MAPAGRPAARSSVLAVWICERFPLRALPCLAESLNCSYDSLSKTSMHAKIYARSWCEVVSFPVVLRSARAVDVGTSMWVKFLFCHVLTCCMYTEDPKCLTWQPGKDSWTCSSCFFDAVENIGRWLVKQTLCQNCTNAINIHE